MRPAATLLTILSATLFLGTSCESGSGPMGPSSQQTPNSPPTAVISGLVTQLISEGDTFSVDALKSSDPDGDSLTYRWLIDGAQFATGPFAVTPMLPMGRTFVVALEATDSQFATSKAEIAVAVRGPRPGKWGGETTDGAKATFTVSAGVFILNSPIVGTPQASDFNLATRCYSTPGRPGAGCQSFCEKIESVLASDFSRELFDNLGSVECSLSGLTGVGNYSVKLTFGAESDSTTADCEVLMSATHQFGCPNVGAGQTSFQMHWVSQ